ncbi:hypothetical protein GCM10023322_06440 [Rugosimonospora acidiphila]|uniref:WxL domain-containing protein n=1 Tax=Rugosimonospora acidiphila TaxID=556531 RepID=A0ABP9RKD8_9ACTN
MTLTVLAALVGTAIAVPAEPAVVDTSTISILAAGTLSITAPANVNLGSTRASGTLTGSLGTVTVSDTRGNLVAAWTATVSSTDFTTGPATPAATIGKANIRYWSGTATATSGVGVFIAGQGTASSAVVLSTTRTAFNLTAGVGNNSASWKPTVIVTVPATALSGTYTGTITHSVA